MHDAHRLGALGQAALDVGGVDAEVVRAEDVGEHRLGAAVAGGGRGGDERDRRHDDLVARPDAGGQHREVQGGGAAREGDRVGDAEMLGELALERVGARAHRQPAGAQRRVDRRAVLLAQREVEERDAQAHPGATLEWPAPNGSSKRPASSASVTSAMPSGTRCETVKPSSLRTRSKLTR